MTDDVGKEQVEELERFRVKLLPYYHAYLLQASKANLSQGYFEQLKEIGEAICYIRKFVGFSREEISQLVGVDSVMFAAFEGGLMAPIDLPDGFVEKLNSVLQHAIMEKKKDKE